MAARVVLVTGASSGIGRVCATWLAAHGDIVWGASRRARECGPGVAPIALDVDDDASLARAIDRIVSESGHIDAVINNAGFGLAGAIEDTSTAEAHAQFETNVFGVLRVCRAVLPHMRARGRGRIVVVGSIAGRIAVPFQGIYSASKFALEGLTEALRHELVPHGIAVSLVEPGDFRTGFTDARRMVAASGPTSGYHARCSAAVEIMTRDERTAPAPDRIGPLVGAILDARAPRLRYTTGPFIQRFAVWLRPWLPSALFEWIIRRVYGV
jgi:NAD(P)-dependent dehydrogenase (short-subunit alcohol dehydrogenase family)